MIDDEPTQTKKTILNQKLKLSILK